MASPRFQIVSDLHLETPLPTPSYTYFSQPNNFPLRAPNLLLLGDIGLVSHPQPLLTFLRSLLMRDPNLQIFYVMGNHEPYHMTLESAVSRLNEWESLLNAEFGQRFHFMNRRRVDINEHITILGCTLWTHVPPLHAQAVASALTDFHEKKGISERSLDDHNADHRTDLAWLNAAVSRIENTEPQREVLVLTHHSPTTDSRANDKRFAEDRPLNSGFRTDLSREICWMSGRVKVWAFGHTHFSCQFVDEGGDREGQKRGKLVVANQKGYAYPEGKGNWRIDPVIVQRVEGKWKVVES
jgi:hypothetical protein